MFTSFPLHPVVSRSLAVAAMAGIGLATASAQDVAPVAAVPSAQPMSFQTAAVPTFTTKLDDASSSSLSSSSLGDPYSPAGAAQTQLASLEKSVLLPGANAMQYGQRRRYGAPRYRGGNTNADGSEKYTFFVGGGFAAPVGTNSNYLGTSYSFQVGGGRNLNRHVGVALQFDWDNFGFASPVLDNQSEVYFGDTSADTGLDGHSHIWSVTLNPTYQIYSGQGLGAYLVVGGGFYHKEATFTLPSLGYGEDAFGDIYEYESAATVQNYSSNSAGVNGGIGVTYKFSRFANEKFYAEARVVHTFNSYRPGDPIVDGNYTGWNLFPQNSQETTYFPVKFGIRF